MGARHSRGIKTRGKRSRLEALVGIYAEKAGFQHEPKEGKVQYLVPEKKRTYLPDYRKDSLIIEAKGRFTSDDRQKMLLIREQHPELSILMVFGRAENYLSKKSNTTYGDWCTKNNISWVDIETFKKEHNKICQLLMIKQGIFGTLPTLPKMKKQAS